MTRAVREIYSDLKDVKHNDPDLSNALKLGKWCLDSLEASDFTESPTKVKFHQAGGGRKKSVPEVHEAMYDWFIDIRSSLKARLTKSMFKAQCKIFYEQWLSPPNKRFQIKQADREERFLGSLKIIWTMRKFFIDNFRVDPPIIDGNQMLLHRKESASKEL